MKRLYLLQRKEKDVGYEEYVAHVVCANDVSQAREIAKNKELHSYDRNRWDNAKVRWLGIASRNLKIGIVLSHMTSA